MARPLSPPGWTREALIRQILVEPRRALFGMPDTRVIERDGWFQIVTPSLKAGGLNEVQCTSLKEADAASVVDETLALYRGLGIRFRWVVGPDSPPFLAALLEARGMRPSWSRAVWRSTDLPATPSGPITVREVDMGSVDTFTRVMAEGWSMPIGPVLDLNRATITRKAYRLFLAHFEGEPAATAGAAMLERSVHLLGGVVLPRFRARGLYRALVAARLGVAAAEGIELATSVAREETSAPILERLGFETVCRLADYVDA